MTTRFWLTNAPPNFTPTTWKGDWDTDTTARMHLGRQPSGAGTEISKSETGTTPGRDVMLAQFISEPARKAGTISGAVAWTIGVMQSSTISQMVRHMHIWVTAGDSDTVRGVLLNNYIGTTAFPTVAAGGYTPTTVTPVSIQAGDRIVVEYGYQANNTTAESQRGYMYYGGTSPTDLSANDTAVLTNPAWLDLEADGLFSTPVGEIKDNFQTGIGDAFTYYGGTFYNANWKRVSVAANDQYPALMAQNKLYEITGSGYYAEIVKMPAGGPNTAFSAYVLGPVDNGTYVRTRYSATTGTLSFELAVGYADASPTTLPYDPMAHRWLRFREAGGTFYWETSPDAKTWTTRRSVTTPQWLKFGTLRINFEGYADAGSATTAAEVDNVNTVPTTVVKVWDGAAWAVKPLKIWDGAAWVQKPVRAWSETAWF